MLEDELELQDPNPRNCYSVAGVESIPMYNYTPSVVYTQAGNPNGHSSATRKGNLLDS